MNKQLCSVFRHFGIMLLFVIIQNAAYAHSDAVETTGDVLQYAIPATAFGTAVILKDTGGKTAFIKSFLLDVGITYGLKYTIRKKRPDCDDEDSFPSGHTSVAFQGAAFIHKRYGFKWSVPAYLGAAFVGYSRIHANRHDLTDVIGGAVIGIVSSACFTTRWESIKISSGLNQDAFVFSVNYIW